jgi:hypothetical protein
MQSSVHSGGLRKRERDEGSKKGNGRRNKVKRRQILYTFNHIKRLYLNAHASKSATTSAANNKNNPTTNMNA